VARFRTQPVCQLPNDVPKVSPRRPRWRRIRGDVLELRLTLSPTLASAKADLLEIVSAASGTFRPDCRFAGTFDAGVKLGVISREELA